MLELDEHNCASYLRDAGLIGRDEQVAVQLLAGGVSNVVFRVQRHPNSGADFVLKQARGRLRVAQPWFCSVERIWREVEVLRVCRGVLQNGADSSGAILGRAKSPNMMCTECEAAITVPEVLFEDRDNYAFAMTAAPREHRTWKEMLLAGEFSTQIAAAYGELLGRLHAGTWHDAALAEQMGDRRFFQDLRVDPYYRRVGEVYPDLKPQVDELIAGLETHSRCLTHGDFSPKNLLVWRAGGVGAAPVVMLVDCEVGHFGDPAFDLGFFLSHLVLKAIFHDRRRAAVLALCESFWASYTEILRPVISPPEFDVLQQRAAGNLAGCLLARVDGKSPVEYLTTQGQKETVRFLARMLFELSPDTVKGGLKMIEEMMESR